MLSKNFLTFRLCMRVFVCMCVLASAFFHRLESRNYCIVLNAKSFFLFDLFFQTNYSFGYGFVNFVSEEGALQAIKTLNGITLRNKRLKVIITTLYESRQKMLN